MLHVTYKIEKKTCYFSYSINGSDLNFIPTIKDLGVLFDSKLTFIPLIENIVVKAEKILGFIY